MADDEQSDVRAAFDNDQQPFEPPSELSKPSTLVVNPRSEVDPGSITPITTVEVILSDTAGLHTTLQEVIFTTPPLRHGLATPAPTHASPHTSFPAVPPNHQTTASAHPQPPPPQL